MLSGFIKRLYPQGDKPVSKLTSKRALGALLVRIAKSDDYYDKDEIARIDQILSRRYDLNPIEAAILRAECEAIEAEAPDTVRFTQAIKEGVDYDERANVIRSFWEVVLADGIRKPEEDALMRMVAPMMGIADTESNMIRQSVEADLA